MALPLGARARRVLRYGGIVLAAIITFVFALQWSLPLDRVKGKLIETLAPSYDITIGDMEHGFWPGRVYLDAVTLRTRPTKADDPVTTFYIERLRVDIGVFAAISGNLSVDLHAKIASGTVSGNITLPGFGKRGLDVHVAGRDLPAGSLPMRALAGLPMSGKMEFEVALDLPNEATKTHTGPNWQKAEGFFEIACPTGCTFGDGKSKLKPLLKNTSQQAMVGDGIDFGKLTSESLAVRAEIKNGSLDITKFEVKSNDGELHVDYAMKLEPNLDDSMVTGCLRFNISETLHKREPTTWAALINTGAERRSDGLFHIKLSDRLRTMLRLNLECGPNAKPEPQPHIGGLHNIVRPNLPPTAPEPPRPATPLAAAPPGGPPPPPPGGAPGTPVSGTIPSAPPAPPEGREPGNRGAEGEGGGAATEGTAAEPGGNPPVQPSQMQ